MKNEDKPRIYRMIHGCTNGDQLQSAWNYIKNAGLDTDPITQEWFKFKKSLIGRI